MAKDEVIIRLELKGSGDHYPTRVLTVHPNSPVHVGRYSASARPESKRIKPSSCNAIFDSPIVSRNHAEFSCGSYSRSLKIKDLGSMHGTFLQGKRLKAHELTHVHDNDEITLGRCGVEGSNKQAISDAKFQTCTFIVTFQPPQEQPARNPNKPLTPDQTPVKPSSRVVIDLSSPTLPNAQLLKSSGARSKEHRRSYAVPEESSDNESDVEADSVELERHSKAPSLAAYEDHDASRNTRESGEKANAHNRTLLNDTSKNGDRSLLHDNENSKSFKIPSTIQASLGSGPPSPSALAEAAMADYVPELTLPTLQSPRQLSWNHLPENLPDSPHSSPTSPILQEMSETFESHRPRCAREHADSNQTSNNSTSSPVSSKGLNPGPGVGLEDSDTGFDEPLETSAKSQIIDQNSNHCSNRGEPSGSVTGPSACTHQTRADKDARPAPWNQKNQGMISTPLYDYERYCNPTTSDGRQSYQSHYSHWQTPLNRGFYFAPQTTRTLSNEFEANRAFHPVGSEQSAHWKRALCNDSASSYIGPPSTADHFVTPQPCSPELFSVHSAQTFGSAKNLPNDNVVDTSKAQNNLSRVSIMNIVESQDVPDRSVSFTTHPLDKGGPTAFENRPPTSATSNKRKVADMLNAISTPAEGASAFDVHTLSSSASLLYDSGSFTKAQPQSFTGPKSVNILGYNNCGNPTVVRSQDDVALIGHECAVVAGVNNTNFQDADKIGIDKNDNRSDFSGEQIPERSMEKEKDDERPSKVIRLSYNPAAAILASQGASSSSNHSDVLVRRGHRSAFAPSRGTQERLKLRRERRWRMSKTIGTFALGALFGSVGVIGALLGLPESFF